MTELYMVQDTSEDHTETWQFLSQRISEASAVNKFISSSDTVSNQAKETITSAIIMVSCVEVFIILVEVAYSLA